MNKYLERLTELDASYNQKFKRVVTTLKETSESDAIQHLAEPYKGEELIYLVEDAKAQLDELKKDYLEKAAEILSEPMEMPKAKIKSELDLRMLKLNTLANSDAENMELLKGTLNDADFNLVKGTLIENKLLAQDMDAIKDLSKVKVITEEEYKLGAKARINNQTSNQNWMPGMDIGTSMQIGKNGINDYLRIVANNQIDNFK